MAPRTLHGWLPGGTSKNVRKHNIFEQKTPENQKMLIIRQIDWREVGWPLSCNAFATARFLVSECIVCYRAVAYFYVIIFLLFYFMDVLAPNAS